MTTFEYTPPETDDEYRVYVLVDNLFDISIRRVEDGIVINVYDYHEIDLLDTLTVDEDSLARNRGNSHDHFHQHNPQCRLPQGPADAQRRKHRLYSDRPALSCASQGEGRTRRTRRRRRSMA
jgi:hypothetical protein